MTSRGFLAANRHIRNIANAASAVVSHRRVALCVFLFALSFTPAPLALGAPPSTTNERKRSVEFAPGVRIDWQTRTVELDAQVVLRDGALELFACSPRSREHESIMVVPARPTHIFQAMGLIGLEPGHPVRYDEKAGRWMAPTGTTLDLRVRYKEEESVREVPIERWLLDVSRNRPVRDLVWVFAGSRTFEDGRFGADGDGTVICVVNFDTALIAINETRSADTELLWVNANTKVIPPNGTRCTILIRDAGVAPLVLEVSFDGTMHLSGQQVSAEDVVRRYGPFGKRSVTRRITLVPREAATAATLQGVIDALVSAGVPRKLVVSESSQAAPPTSSPADSN